MQRTEVETVARAFYYTSEYARGWEREPEPLKRSFRTWAHAALVSDRLCNTQERNVGPELTGVPTWNVGKVRSLYRLKPWAATFIAVLTGPEHTFQIANNPYRLIVGRRRLTGRPVREAFPEVEGQGFFELLDMVHETGLSFQGNKLSFKVQKRHGQPPEGMLIDLTYKPVINETGKRLGILVKGRDVTARINGSHT